jgi:hypothetical protein
VVIKILPPELAHAVSGERFRHEIRFAARLTHPHIMPLLISIGKTRHACPPPTEFAAQPPEIPPKPFTRAPEMVSPAESPATFDPCRPPIPRDHAS